MKKTILSVLIVLLLSFGFLGCGDQPCEVCGAATKAECVCKAADKSDLSGAERKALRDDLTAMGEDPATFPTPLGTTFDKYQYAPLTSSIVIVWKDANEPMFDHYKKAWETRARAAVSVSDNSTFVSASIEFYPDGGTDPLLSVAIPAGGAIVFTGRK